MSDWLISLWCSVIIVALVGGIPYGIWILCKAWRKQWKGVCGLVIAPLLIFSILKGVTAIDMLGADERAEREFSLYLQGVFDAEVELGDPIYEFQTRRDFNGDGYTLMVYDLPSTIRSRFEAADDELLLEFPKDTDFRTDWATEHWRQGPLDPQFQEQLDFALTQYYGEPESGLTAQFEAIRQAISKQGGYYAFVYNTQEQYPNDPDSRTGNIDFFVVDLIGNRLYSINHNT